MLEAQLFEPGTVPEWTTPEWYAEREAAPHLEQEGHRQRLQKSAEFARRTGALTVVDLGAGDGGLLSLLEPRQIRWGYDLQASNVEASKRRNQDVRLLDVVAGFDRVEWADCVVLTEMLEHLIDPHGLLRRIHDETPAQWLVASSPYTETVESHYGFHTWVWDQQGYEAMLERSGWRPIDRDVAWICQVVLCERA